MLFYRYLGVELDTCLNFKMFKERVLARAKSSMTRIWGMVFVQDICRSKGPLNLYQGLVRSVLEYGSQIWGKEKWAQGEQVQVEMGIRVLQCSTMSTREVKS